MSRLGGDDDVCRCHTAFFGRRSAGTVSCHRSWRFCSWGPVCTIGPRLQLHRVSTSLARFFRRERHNRPVPMKCSQAHPRRRAWRTKLKNPPPTGSIPCSDGDGTRLQFLAFLFYRLCVGRPAYAASMVATRVLLDPQPTRYRYRNSAAQPLAYLFASLLTATRSSAQDKFQHLTPEVDMMMCWTKIGPGDGKDGSSFGTLHMDGMV